MTTWILCPNLWGARLFQYQTPEEGVKFLRELPRPKQRSDFEDFPTDDEVPEITEDPQEHEKEVAIASRFSELLNRQLQHYERLGFFDSLILCAEAQFLEILKRHLSPSLRRKIIGAVELDLYEANESDLINYVKDFLTRVA